jgi:hypothetical protein
VADDDGTTCLLNEEEDEDEDDELELVVVVVVVVAITLLFDTDRSLLIKDWPPFVSKETSGVAGEIQLLLLLLNLANLVSFGSAMLLCKETTVFSSRGLVVAVVVVADDLTDEVGELAVSRAASAEVILFMI